MIGKTVSHYKILEKLGEGGMGEVYRARDTKLGRDVALKTLPQALSGDPERRRRFEREARVIAALNHPNIVTIHSVEEADGHLFLTMELVQGTTLRHAMRPEGMTLDAFFSVAVPMVDAVCSAHGQGITHRDLKPANVMINQEGRLKVLDFGLAKLVQQTTGEEETIGMDADTAEGHVMGTVSYMSPEQVEGKAVDGRSDVFSLGILFYEMLTGKRPFTGDSNASTISAILRDTPPAVSEVRAHLPNHLGRIIRRCLAKEPDRRYQTALDLRNDLQELKDEVDSGDVVVGEAASGAPSAAPTAPTDDASSGPQRPTSDSIVLPGKRRTYGWVLGAVALIALATIIIGIVNRGSDAPRTASQAPSTEEATLGVIGFENLSDPEDTENLGRVLMSLVTTGLAESGGLRVASTAKVLAGRRQAGADAKTFDASLAPAAAKHAGADIMLVGQVIRDGERMILTCELVDVRSGNVLGSFKEQAASNSELFELAEAIADDVRDELDVTVEKGAAGSFDFARSLTSSPEAYRHYVSGEMALQQGQYAEAIESLDRAIEIDPSFALAYLRRMLASTWGGDEERGLQLMKVGLAHVDRLPERWQVVYRATLDFYEGRVDAAHDAMIALAEAGTDVPDAYDMLGEIATHHSKYLDVKLSREYFERALEIDPNHEVVFFHLVETYIAMRDFRAVNRLIERYRDANAIDSRVVGAELALWEADHRYADVVEKLEAGERVGSQAERWTQQARCYEALGEWDKAWTLLDSLVRAGQRGHLQGILLMQRASAQIGRGNIAAAAADYDGAVERMLVAQGRGTWANDLAAYYLLSKAFVLLQVGQFEAALEAAQRAVETDPAKTWTYLNRMQILIKLGRSAEAEAALHDLERVRAENVNPSDPFYEYLARALWAHQQGRSDEALDMIRRADEMPIETRQPWIQWWIEAEIRAANGDREGAIRAYKNILDRPSFLVHMHFIHAAFQIPFHYELARLLEEAGRTDKAREHYTAYLERWGEADVTIPNVEDARQRLARLP